MVILALPGMNAGAGVGIRGKLWGWGWVSTWGGLGYIDPAPLFVQTPDPSLRQLDFFSAPVEIHHLSRLSHSCQVDRKEKPSHNPTLSHTPTHNNGIPPQ